MDDSLDKLDGFPLYQAVSRELAQLYGLPQAGILLRMLYCRAVYGIGARDYALFGLQHKPLARMGGYKNKTQTTEYFERMNPAGERWRTRDKINFCRLCLEAGIRTPEIRLILAHGDPEHTKGFTLRRRFKDVLEYFRHENDLALILKPSADTRGSGVRFLRLRGGIGYDMNGHPIDVEEWDSQIDGYLKNQCYLVQTFLPPDPVMASLGSGRALGTIRVMTSYLQGRFAIHFALARIPCGENIQDNFIGGRSENLIASVDAETGVLGAAYGRRRDPNSFSLERFARNPDTGNPIEGVTVPRWPEVLQLLRHGASSFAALPFLGWDIGLTPEAAFVVEANWNADIIGAQVTAPYGAFDLLPKLAA